MKKIISLLLLISLIATMGFSALAANVSVSAGSGIELALVEDKDGIITATLYLCGPIGETTGKELTAYALYLKYPTDSMTPCYYDDDKKEWVVYSGGTTAISNSDVMGKYTTLLHPYINKDHFDMAGNTITPGDATKNLIFTLAQIKGTDKYSLTTAKREAILSMCFKKTAEKTITASSITYPYKATPALKSTITLADTNTIANGGTDNNAAAFMVSYTLDDDDDDQGYDADATDKLEGTKNVTDLSGGVYTFNGTIVELATVTECGIEITTPNSKIYKFPALTAMKADGGSNVTGGKFAIEIIGFDDVKVDGDYEIRAYYKDADGGVAYLTDGTDAAYTTIVK